MAHAKAIGPEQFVDGDRHLLLSRLAGLVCRSERVVGYPTGCRSLRRCENARSPEQFGLKRASVIERQEARQIQAPSRSPLVLWNRVNTPINPQAWDQRRGREDPANGRVMRRLGRLWPW